MKKIISVSLFTFLLLFACQKEEANSDSTVVDGSKEDYTIERVVGCENIESVCQRLKITYPSFMEFEPPLQQVIDESMRDYISDFLITDMPLETNNFQEFASKSADAIIEERKDKDISYSFFFDFTKQYTNDFLFCMKNIYKLQEDVGDERGLGYTLFDIQSSEILQVPQIIYLERPIEQILLKKLKNQYGIPENEDIEDHGFYVSDRDFAVTDNIGLNNKEVIFTYLPLEIAPEEKGIMSFSIEKDQISPYLVEGFVKKWES